MRLEVRHRTAYRYSEPVWLGPQSIRLRPRSDVTQRLIEFEMSMQPQAAGFSDNLDLDGNAEHLAWFSDRTEALALEMRSVVETMRINPFDFLWRGPETLPIRYPDELQQRLSIYMGASESQAVKDFARGVAESVGHQAQALPMALTRAVSTFSHEVRESGNPMTPEQTLSLAAGACRDLTVLYMAAARYLGFATRFVSGYFYTLDEDVHELHAWPEIFLPGGGWRGFDATHALAVADRHIALVAAPDFRGASPVGGIYRGRARSVLETSVVIRDLGNEAGQLQWQGKPD